MDQSTFLKLKENSVRQKNSTAHDRILSLQKLSAWLKKNENLIFEALDKDFKKPAFETLSTEISMLYTEINYFVKNLKKLTRPKKVPTPMTLLGHTSQIKYEAKGVVLIIAPWNYPFLLAIDPLIPALAAGNVVVLKPSEITVHTTNLIKKMITDVFSADQVLVELGGKEVTTELLTFDFDHVFFTGSTEVGRIIAEKCAKKLIPYTLELGGKSPTIIDETADIKDAAEKIYWGKYLNRGQTCVAPDYILIQNSVKQKFIEVFNALEKNNFEKPAVFVNEHHKNRVLALTQSKIDFDKVSCALIETTDLNDKLMQSEIFGPVAPVIGFAKIEEIYKIMALNPYPLALYIFSKSRENINSILAKTQSGGVAINSLIVHLANHHLPFGGLRTSGVGRYHGYDGFLEFTHHRAVIEQKRFNFLLKFVFPPYTDFKKKLLKYV